jgi:UDP-2,4-diacetamido-2,4,6-trideoxy-beta-L-altropyranose hydrolase
MVNDTPRSPGVFARPLTIVVRADASSEIGTGHVLRNLGLADELRARGHTVLFVCSSAPGHLIELVRSRGYRCEALPPGIDISEDARLTTAAATRLGRPVDWLIVDHYGLDARWEQIARRVARRLFVIDDLADRPHEGDVLLDSAHDESVADLYRRLVPPTTKLLLGPRYILLRREFFSRPHAPRLPAAVRRILVTFGGNDPLNMTGLALRALAQPVFAPLVIDVTLGLSNPRLEEVRKQAQAIANVTVYVQHPEPSKLMAQADLCLGAGGTTTWERCYLGLPTLIVVLAENQQDFAEACDRLGVVRYIGRGEMLSADDLRNAVVSAMDDSSWRVASSAAGQALVDGKGISRVVNAIEGEEEQVGS